MPKKTKRIELLINEIKAAGGKPEREAFARKCGTSLGMLQQVGGGHRNCSINLAVGIDKATDGRVDFRDMFPDLDWGYVEKRLLAGKSGSSIA